jgi:hypothetical protein
MSDAEKLNYLLIGKNLHMLDNIIFYFQATHGISVSNILIATTITEAVRVINSGKIDIVIMYDLIDLDGFKKAGIKMNFHWKKTGHAVAAFLSGIIEQKKLNIKICCCYPIRWSDEFAASLDEAVGEVGMTLFVQAPQDSFMSQFSGIIDWATQE